MAPSTLTWLAHDEADRRRIQELVDQFREQGTLDDLGLGSVRDAYSNLLFPGTSVLQTRARYLLFIPWIYGRLEKDGVRSRDIAARARLEEIRLIEALLANGEDRGVIGSRARATLKLLPSTAYWTGLGRLGFRTFSGTQEQYHRSFDSNRLAARGAPRVADGEDPVAIGYANWHPTLNALAAQALGFPGDARLALTADEGSFIRELIMRHAKGTLLAFLCASGMRSAVRYPWLHPGVADSPAEIRRQLELARSLSGLMQGASLVYNLMLARRRKLEEPRDQLLQWLQAWAGELQAELVEFDWDEFWFVALQGNPRITMPTRTFIENWSSLTRALGAGVADDAAAQALIERRERQTKQAQARLSNPRRLETWNEPVGLGRLDYRWPVVQDIVNDLASALRR